MRKILLNFETIYQVFNSRIISGFDCGKFICGNSACCHPARSGSFICFLPGEYEFLCKKFRRKLPFVKLKSGYRHCRGREFCLGDFRPIDCRSYPLWPFVSKKQFVGFVDCRGERCPLRGIPPKFIVKIKDSWDFIFKNSPGMLGWVENKTYANGPLIVFPKYRVERYVNEAKGRVSLSG